MAAQPALHSTRITRRHFATDDYLQQHNKSATQAPYSSKAKLRHLQCVEKPVDCGALTGGCIAENLADEVICVCNVEMAVVIACGPAEYPSREPVMAWRLENPLMT